MVAISAPSAGAVQHAQASAPDFDLHVSTPFSKASVFLVQSKKNFRKLNILFNNINHM